MLIYLISSRILQILVDSNLELTIAILSFAWYHLKEANEQVN